MAGVEGKKKSLLSRSVGLLRRVGELVFFVLCVFAPKDFVGDLQD